MAVFVELQLVSLRIFLAVTISAGAVLRGAFNRFSSFFAKQLKTVCKINLKLEWPSEQMLLGKS